VTKIPTPAFIVHEGGYHWVAQGAPEERCVLGPEVRDLLPAGTVTIDADECYAISAGGGGFYLDEAEGIHLGDENVTTPAYIHWCPVHVGPGVGGIRNLRLGEDRRLSRPNNPCLPRYRLADALKERALAGSCAVPTAHM
jgi:hypothetical protein